MRHRKTIKHLDRNMKQRRALVKNLANSLILYEKITTTVAKAKVLKPRLEKMVTRAKVDSLHHRRLLLRALPTENAVKKMFAVIGPRYKDRHGGYLRIIKAGPRQSDGAQMAIIEFV